MVVVMMMVIVMVLMMVMVMMVVMMMVVMMMMMVIRVINTINFMRMAFFSQCIQSPGEIVHWFQPFRSASTFTQ